MEDRSAIEAGYLAVALLDPVLARLVEQHDHPNPYDWRDGGRTGESSFAAMVLHIVGQRVTTTSGYRIYDRVAEASGRIPTPDDILGLTTEQLRLCGMPPAKADFLHELARAQRGGLLDLDDFADSSDEQVTAALTAVKGIGPWSATMFLIHQLRRPDVFPSGDNGLRRAVQLSWHLEAPPAPAQLGQRALRWSPYRTFAAAILWKSLPTDPKSEALRLLSPPTYL